MHKAPTIAGSLAGCAQPEPQEQPRLAYLLERLDMKLRNISEAAERMTYANDRLGAPNLPVDPVPDVPNASNALEGLERCVEIADRLSDRLHHEASRLNRVI